MLLFGGDETARNLIGNGIYSLLRHPREFAELRDHPQLIRTAVEELLRYESPVQYTGRMMLEKFELCGFRARPGQEIVFMLGAANRDPQQFKDLDTLRCDTREQSVPGVWRRGTLLHWESTRPPRRPGGNFAIGAAVPAVTAPRGAS